MHSGWPVSKAGLAPTQLMLIHLPLPLSLPVSQSSPSSLVSVPTSLSLTLILDHYFVSVIFTAIPPALACPKAICVRHAAHSVVKLTHSAVISMYSGRLSVLGALVQP